MPGSSDFHNAVLSALAGEEAPAGAFLPGAQDRGRLAVYRNNRAVALADTISRAYPAVRTLVGNRFMRALAIEFARRHPPRDPVLALYGAELPDFMEDFPPLAHLPYLAGVARLDRAWSEAHFASDAGLDDPAPEPGEPLALSARTRRVVLDWPVHDLWHSSRAGLGPPSDQLAPRREDCLVWRGPDGMDSAALAPAEAAALDRVLAGEPGDPAQLGDLVERGALTARRNKEIAR